MIGRLLMLVCLLMIALPARAADVSLPLGGYYRPGRYMPVRFSAKGDAELRLAADGAVTTLVQSPTSGIVPWLIVSSPAGPPPFSMSLHELPAGLKLVGFATNAREVGAELFPGFAVIPIDLDPSHPLPGPAAAWQALDAVVLSASAAGRLPEQDRAALLAGGTSLAVRDDTGAPPDAIFPWRKMGGFWIAQSPSAFAATASDEAYEPISSWQPGRPSTYRRQIVLFGVVFSILFIALTLWRSRWVAGGAIMLAVAAIAGFEFWDARQSPVASAGGWIRVIDGAWSSDDAWLFQRSPRAIDETLPWGGLVLPVLPRHGGPERMTLVCDSTGNPVDFHYHLPADLPAAFVSRQFGKSQSAAPVLPVTSPLRQIVGSMYPSLRIAGQIDDAAPSATGPARWPTIVLKRAD